MCYDISTPGLTKLIKELPEYKINYNGIQFYHVSAHTQPFLPVTTNDNHRTVEAAQWKLLPLTEKAKEENTYNIKSETIFKKDTYKHYITKYRGLLWADGFYEPYQVEDQQKSENYYVYLPEKRIFSIGIVYAPWLNTETGETINIFSILTTPANDLLTEMQGEKKRMPLIIPPDQRDAWLDTNEEEHIRKFFVPFNGLLSAHKVPVRQS